MKKLLSLGVFLVVILASACKEENRYEMTTFNHIEFSELQFVVLDKQSGVAYFVEGNQQGWVSKKIDVIKNAK